MSTILIFLVSILTLSNGQNQLINSDFTDPPVPTGTVVFLQQIQGWSCINLCEIIECHSYFPLSNCSNNYIDLNCNGNM